MQPLTGKITTAEPPDFQDDYGNQHQNIVITGESGRTCAGRIASKNGYATGTDITVIVTQESNSQGAYNRFRRQQQQGGYSGGGQRGGGQQKGNIDRLIVAQVVYKAHMEAKGKCSEIECRADADMIMRVGSGQPAPQPQVQSNPEYSDDPAPIDENDPIPF